MHSFPSAVFSIDPQTQTWICEQTSDDFSVFDVEATRNLIDERLNAPQDVSPQFLGLPSGRTAICHWLAPGRVRAISVEQPSADQKYPTEAEVRQIDEASPIEPGQGWFQQDVLLTGDALFTSTITGRFDPSILDPSLVDLDQNDTLDTLDQIDELAFAAIGGGERERIALQDAWPKLKARVPRHLVDESRAEYVRRILEQWPSESHDPGGEAPPNHARALLEILFSS